jgi:hypothetical protein
MRQIFSPISLAGHGFPRQTCNRSAVANANDRRRRVGGMYGQAMFAYNVRIPPGTMPAGDFLPS